MLQKRKFFTILLVILSFVSLFVSSGFCGKNSSFDDYRNIIKLANIDEADEDKDAILSYQKMLELQPQSYWTIAALNFIKEGPAANVEKRFEEYLKPNTDASKIVLCTLYYYRWPKDFLKLVSEVENSPTIYGVYANMLLSFYYSGFAPDHPTDPEKGLSYLIKASKISKMSKEVEIYISEEIAGIYISHMHKETEGLKINEEILKKVSTDKELAALYQNELYKQELYVKMIISYSKNNKKEEAKKYFEIMKKEIPTYKEFDSLEKEFIDPNSHPRLQIKY